MKKEFCRKLLLCSVSVTVSISLSCRGSQSALDPAGIQSERLESLWWLFFSVTGAVYLIVMTVLLIAFFRRRKASSETSPELQPKPDGEKRLSNVIKAAVALTTIVLFVLMIVSFRAGRVVHSLAQGEDEPLSIRIKGQQWWWEVEYQDKIPSNNVTTANEIHLPVGRRVKIQVESTDVIHSFWVPNLHGKVDLIPNYRTTFFLRADKPGTYFGQCAEFCGYQHAKMRFIVIAESPADFDKWLQAQQQPGAPPTTDSQKRGQEIFLTTTCAQCHTIQGTPAFGRVGPNLTHIASRPYLAAGSLQNTREHLQSWVTDAQRIKPGNRMPMNPYSPDDLQALLDYLESLK